MRFLGQILCQKCIQPLKCDVLSISWMSQISCLQNFNRRISVSSETNSLQNGRIQLSEEVSQALSDCKPVVALESTIITHGMPYPQNLQTALEVEETVRDNGCIPATIGVIAGQVHVGLDQTNMERLGSATRDLVKISRRDLAFAMSKKLSGGATVSSTMLIANQVGIDVFATGGIGGVHRGAQHTMDVSADLTELGRTPVAVVSAGVKSILDIEKTLEYLETQGVCVATFGKDKDFPAFFTPSSGLRAPFNVDNEIQAAELIYASQYELKLKNGILIGVPIPEIFADAGEEIEEAIQIAIKESREKKVVGKEVTPYILKRVHELTHGGSLQANIALIKNNAVVGSKVAWQLNKLINNNKNVPDTTGRSHVIRKNNSSSAKKKRPVVIGGTVVDFNARMKHTDIQSNGSTNPGSIQQSFGGVGRNLADCLSRLGAQPLFISAVGDDSHADTFISHCQHMV
ncbi:pseudouridine-5'-phosphate glycosidase isoform X2 [Patella vulgata]|uniref:pseudouridine-5'-phosphate glycosidase isoform X2 n=1 Tax=Patella vulgata TaxID=6465 RepID=UPI0024A87578|nr:pseudouridine-5'-phosphate glycosidase isoform X2 [Patella vulgata]